MSDLKYQTVSQLEHSKKVCEGYIKDLESKLAGQRERLKWIEKYLFQKTPVEMTLDEVEARLGHKVILKLKSPVA